MTAEQPEGPTPRCIVCRHPRPEWEVCPGCVARVDRQLAAILDLHALAATAAGLTRPTTGEHSGASVGRTPPLPLNLTALDLAHGEWLLSTDEDPDLPGDPPWTGLEGWEQDWRTVLDLRPYGAASANRLGRSMARMPIPGARAGRTATGPPDPSPSANPRPASRTATSATLAGCIGFLRAWWPQAAQRHPAADEFAHDIQRMHSAATAALQLHDARPWTVPCPATTEAGDCGYRLRLEHAGRELLLHCPRCGSDWDTDRLLLVAAAAGRGVWVSAAEAAERIGVHRATIHRAVATGAVVSRYSRVDLLTVHEWAANRGRTA